MPRGNSVPWCLPGRAERLTAAVLTHPRGAMVHDRALGKRRRRSGASAMAYCGELITSPGRARGRCAQGRVAAAGPVPGERPLGQKVNALACAQPLRTAGSPGHTLSNVANEPLNRSARGRPSSPNRTAAGGLAGNPGDCASAQLLPAPRIGRKAAIARTIKQYKNVGPKLYAWTCTYK